MSDQTTSPEGIASLLDTDLYKLTMQCAVLRSYPEAHCTYAFTNRTPDLKISRRGFAWLQERVSDLSRLRLTADEAGFLAAKCPYLPPAYIAYLSQFRFLPDEQLVLSFTPTAAGSSQRTQQEVEEEGSQEHDELGDLEVAVRGKWVETILYEIPLLVLVSECYFRFSDTDWNDDGQEERAYEKGVRLLSNGCVFSEFGTRRRRSYRTQEQVLLGLMRAAKDFSSSSSSPSPSSSTAGGGGGSASAGSLAGTSNVHFAHRFGLTPIGTVAHEWMMGIAALTGTYRTANEVALQQWFACFGTSLSIALTDTFGTPQFLQCFRKMCAAASPPRPYAEIFAGVRQDSGDPVEFVRLMRRFYDSVGVQDRKVIVFSDSLDVEKCLQYKQAAEAHGFATSFGVGTFLTNDFVHRSAAREGSKSIPLNIVIKIASVNGRPAIKISDNIGKNTGDEQEVRRVKEELGYQEKQWEGGDEMWRWGGNRS